MEEWIHFLNRPLWDHILLNWQLALAVPILLLLRFIPSLPRKFFLLTYSFFFIVIFTSVFYTGLFLGVSLALYYFLFWLQHQPFKKAASYALAALLVLFFFLCLDWEALRSPWTGPAVHAFGISYSLFRLLALVLDVGKGMPIPVSPLDFLNFAFFYPTFFMGPIERFQEFQKNNLSGTQSDGPRLLQGSAWQKIIFNILRIAGALLKGYFVARFLGFNWDQYFNYPQQLSYGVLWWGMYVRAFGFYLMVSACNDLSIACCALAGYKIHENYNFPYFRRNLAEFWRNWHMTLLRFLRDYVYIPMGGNRKHVYFNTLVIFLFIALWHVTSPAFLLWGLWHGVGMCFLIFWKKFWKRVEENPSEIFLKKLQRGSHRYPKITYGLSMLFTFHFVALGWLPFWGGYPQGASMILRLLSGNHFTLFEWEP